MYRQFLACNLRQICATPPCKRPLLGISDLRPQNRPKPPQPLISRQKKTGVALKFHRNFWGKSFCHWEIKGRFRKRVVLASVPLFQFSFWGNMRTYPHSGFCSGGTSECTLVPVRVPGEHPPKPPFWKPPFDGLQSQFWPCPGPKGGCCLEGFLRRWSWGELNGQPLSEYGFAYGLNTEMCQFSKNFSCEPHREGKETCLCPSTDRVRFRLFPSTVSAGHEYGLDRFRVRFRYPLRWERVREPHAKQYSDSALNGDESYTGAFPKFSQNVLPFCPCLSSFVRFLGPESRRVLF